MAGHIFLNYRREDSIGTTRHLHDILSSKFGAGRVFIDNETIRPGRDFVDEIDSAVRKSHVMISVVGPSWLSVTIEDSDQSRLHDPTDFVRLEIEAGLARRIPIIPVLVDGAHHPLERELPESIRSLARRQAVRLTPENFRSDVERLVAAIRIAMALFRRLVAVCSSDCAVAAGGHYESPGFSGACRSARWADQRAA